MVPWALSPRPRGVLGRSPFGGGNVRPTPLGGEIPSTLPGWCYLTPLYGQNKSLGPDELLNDITALRIVAQRSGGSYTKGLGSLQGVTASGKRVEPPPGYTPPAKRFLYWRLKECNVYTFPAESSFGTERSLT